MSHNTKYFFIAGNPVSHSKSPQLFDAYARDAELPHRYIKALCTKADDVELLLRNGFSGGNITAPLKEEILSLGYPRSLTVDKLRAANTIFELNGELMFENTDGYGVIDALLPVVGSFTGKKAVVTGIGGAGRAAFWALLQLGCEVSILNRSMENALYWAEIFGCRAYGLYQPADSILNADIIINTVPVVDSMIDHIQKHHIILDADYRNCPLKELAVTAGATYISGTEWLMYQAVPAFTLFGNRVCGIDILKESLQKEHLQPKKNIILVGMMMSGKTTVGQILAKKLEMKFTDTDTLIEQMTGKTITEIFEQEGEHRFRHYENEVFRKCIDSENQVIATGGGLVLEAENRKGIHKKGIVVWLFTSAKELASRSDSQSRPLLDTDNKEKRLTELLGRRFSDYIQSTELLIPTDDKTPEKIAELIAGSLR